MYANIFSLWFHWFVSTKLILEKLSKHICSTVGKTHIYEINKHFITDGNTRIWDRSQIFLPLQNLWYTTDLTLHWNWRRQIHWAKCAMKGILYFKKKQSKYFAYFDVNPGNVQTRMYVWQRGKEREKQKEKEWKIKRREKTTTEKQTNKQKTDNTSCKIHVDR